MNEIKPLAWLGDPGLKEEVVLRMKEHRAEDSAAQDRAGEPAPVAGREACALGALQREQQREPDAGAEIKQAREQPGADVAEQQLRQRRARAEEQRRTQRRRNSALQLN